MLIGSELLSYRTEGLFLFVYRFLIESNGFELSGQGEDKSMKFAAHPWFAAVSCMGAIRLPLNQFALTKAPTNINIQRIMGIPVLDYSCFIISHLYFNLSGEDVAL